LDESTDVVDVAQLCVFIRMIFEDMRAKEELLTIMPLKGHTRGEDIFNSFMDFVKKNNLPLFKLISITTDGAPAMVGHTNGFIALCKQSESFPDILNYHCIIHQQALCGKILNMKEVMDVAMKIVFFSEGLHIFSYSVGTVIGAISVHLCNTDGCNSEDIPYPGDQKKNGRQCVTCDDPFSTVCTRTVQCVGVQDRCFNMTVEYKHHEMPTSYTLGCISSNFCEDTRRFPYLITSNSVRNAKFNVECGGNIAWSVRLNVMSLLLGLFTLTFY
ncbi:general transcription factor II-I repeat domain-containing 2A-like protein, partial [Scomber scombrus]